jgi:hypothetical protein
VKRDRVSLLLAACLSVALSLSKGERSAALAAGEPALLVATPTFLMYAEGDRRQAAVASGGTSSYRILGLTNGGVLVAFDDGFYSNVELVTPALESRKIRTFPRGTTIYPGTDGFLTLEGSSQLVRRYDARGAFLNPPIVALGASEVMGVGDNVVSLGNGRLRVWDSRGRLRKDTILDGNALTPMPDNRFAVNDTRDGEVRVYSVDLEQTATLRYVGLPVRGLAASPDGALAVLAGTPGCILPNAEIDVFTDLHAQPAARIHENVTSTVQIALGADYVYALNGPCRANEDATIAVFRRDGTTHSIMRNVGTPTSLIPFQRKT